MEKVGGGEGKMGPRDSFVQIPVRADFDEEDGGPGGGSLDDEYENADEETQVSPEMRRGGEESSPERDRAY